MSKLCKYPLSVESLDKSMFTRELAEQLASVFAQASPAVRDALERGWFDPPSDFFDVPSATNSYTLRTLMVGWSPAAASAADAEPAPMTLIDVAELDAFEASLRELAASLNEPTDLADLIGGMDDAGFGIAAAPVVQYAHELLRSMTTTEALTFLGAGDSRNNDDWRVWEKPNDAEATDSAEARSQRLLRKQALVTGDDIKRVRAAAAVN